MKDINLNRWAKLAGINENDDNTSLKEGNEEWEGSINGLGKDDHPKEFAKIRSIILSDYPNEGGSTYRMSVNYDENGIVKYAKGGFMDEDGQVDFKFQFEDGNVVDYSFENKQDK